MSVLTQAISCLNKPILGLHAAGKAAQVIANDFKCSIRSIEYCKSISQITVDVGTGYPQDSSTGHNVFINHQHVINPFIKVAENTRKNIVIRKK